MESIVARHMGRLSRGAAIAAPMVAVVDQQVRTSMSVPFQRHMLAVADQPSVATVDQQVRTSMSVPFNPYMLGDHAEELLKRRVMISPVLSVWQYEIADGEAFRAWLSTREILLSEGRLAGDGQVRGVRYGGTYRVGAERDNRSATYKTVWGFSCESAMLSMQRLCSDQSASASIVQVDLIDFVKGMRSFAARCGSKPIAEEVLVSTAAG